MPRLLIATNNSHKTAELDAMLQGRWEVLDLRALPGVTLPPETGATFIENAVIKALAASALHPALVLADDSGLEVDALNGAPGIWSARYAGAQTNDSANRVRLLRELAAAGAITPAARTAQFRCALALARRGKLIATVEGIVRGSIIDHEQGSGGFGYDPLFVPEGLTATFAELPAAKKNRLSHRGRALQKMLPLLEADD
jgi:XTP/dITP diphosphohydrolase